MEKLASRSIFWLAIALIVDNVAQILVEESWGIDFLPLILLWIASAIASGSTTACRWAVFFLGVCILGRSNSVHELITDSMPRAGQNLPVAVDISLSVVISLWSLVNLFLAERVLRQANQTMLSPFVRKAAIGIATLAVLMPIIRYVATPPYAHPGAIEERYAQQMAFLRDFAATNQDILDFADEVQAVFENHPEILEAEVQTGRNSYQSILGFRVREKSTWFNRFGTAVDEEDGTEIPIVVYTGWTRNARGERLEIRMIIKDIWRDGG